MDKTILLATFIKKEKLQLYIENLTEKHNVIKKEIYIYETSNDFNNLIVFKYTYHEYDGKKIKSLFPETFIVHKKGDTIYTINALNKIIEIDNNLKIGNIDYKSVKINWVNYKNKLLVIKNNQLKTSNINRIFQY